MTFTATLTDVRPLVFEGADVHRDLPGHVRAGSAPEIDVSRVPM